MARLPHIPHQESGMPDPTDTILAYLRQVGLGLDPDFLREAVRVMSALRDVDRGQTKDRG